MPALTLAVIPARFASTRLPGKPLLRRTGKYLIQHVWERVRQARKIDRVIVATDDRRIAAACEEFGAECMMTSRRHPTGTSRVAEVARRIRADRVINIQGDEPEIPPAAIDLLATSLRTCSVATLAAPPPRRANPKDPNRVKVVCDRRGNAVYFSRSLIPYPRNPAPPLFHAGIYACRIEALLRWVALPPGPLEKAESLEQLRLLENGVPIRVLVWNEPWPGGIDTPADYAAFVRRFASLRPKRRSRP